MRYLFSLLLDGMPTATRAICSDSVWVGSPWLPPRPDGELFESPSSLCSEGSVFIILFAVSVVSENMGRGERAQWRLYAVLLKIPDSCGSSVPWDGCELC